jgi:hypothetical protein
MHSALIQDTIAMARDMHASLRDRNRDAAAADLCSAALATTLDAASRQLSHVEHHRHLTTNVISAVPRILESCTDSNTSLVNFAAAPTLDHLAKAISQSKLAIRAMHQAVQHANAASANLSAARDTANASIGTFNAKADAWNQCKAAWAACQGEPTPPKFVHTPLLQTTLTANEYDAYLIDAHQWDHDNERIFLALCGTYPYPPQPAIANNDPHFDDSNGHGDTPPLLAHHNDLLGHARLAKERTVSAANSIVQTRAKGHAHAVLQLQAANTHAQAANHTLLQARNRQSDAVQHHAAFRATIQAAIDPEVVALSDARAYKTHALGAQSQSDQAALDFAASLPNTLAAVGTGVDPAAISASIKTIAIDAARAVEARNYAHRALIFAAAMETTATHHPPHPPLPAPNPLPHTVPAAGNLPLLCATTPLRTPTPLGVAVENIIITPNKRETSPLCMVTLCTGTCKPDPTRAMHFICSTCSSSFQSSWWAEKVRTWHTDDPPRPRLVGRSRRRTKKHNTVPNDDYVV